MELKKHIFTILLVLLLFVLIGSVSAADIDANDTQIASVSDNDDILSVENDVDVLSEDGQYTYSDLREQIGKGGRVNLTKGYYTYNNDGNTIEISVPSVINGNGAVIDMSRSGIRAFNVTTSNVLIENLTIKNANYNGDGGAIYFSGLSVVSNCNFNDNTASGKGGAIYCNWNTLYIENCNFNDNSANVGGGVFFGGNAYITNSNFTNNSASNYGGAIVCVWDSIITNCSFTDNSAIAEAGAINLGSTSVENCSFTNNSATYGGAILMRSGSVKYCNFMENNASGDNGGAIYMFSGSVENCNFTDNKATDNGDGGAIAMESGSVKYCNFTDNKANGEYGSGGAIYVTKYGTGNMKNCNFNNNFARYGGAIFAEYNSIANLTNCNFSDNHAEGYLSSGGAVWIGSGSVIKCNFIDNGVEGYGSYGGAVFFYSDGTVTGCNFTHNLASNQGGAIFLYKGGNVKDCNFNENYAGEGDAIYNDRNCALSLSNNNISSTKAEIYNHGQIISITNVTVLENKTVNAKYDQNLTLNATYTDDNGNLIYDPIFYFIVAGVADPIPATYADGLYTATYKVDKIEQKVVSANLSYTVTTYDALLDISKANVELTIECNETIFRTQNETITVKLVDEFGNSLNESIEIRVTYGGNTIFECQATTENSAYSFNLTYGNTYGTYTDIGEYVILVIHQETDNYSFTNASGNFEVVKINITGTYTELQQLIDNDTVGKITIPNDITYNLLIDTYYGHTSIVINKDIIIDGNGTTISGEKLHRIFTIEPGVTVTIANLTLKNGIADIGGAILTYADSLTISACNFIGNDPINGSALNIQKGNVIVNENSLFENNTATGCGGAIYVNAGANLTVNNARFKNNTANYGGAIYIIGSGTMTNCIFTNNRVTSRGGAMFGGSVVNCTFIGNNAEHGGAINVGSGDVINCTFIRNAAKDWGGAMNDCSGDVINCTFTGNSAIHGAGINTASNNVINCNFTDNYASEYGGAIRFNGVSSAINCNFTNNVAYEYYGGAIYFDSEGAVINCNFTDNSAFRGGAVCIKSSGNVTNCNFRDNRADYPYGKYSGGAIWMGGYATVTDCNFTNNHAIYGGAINFIGDSTVTNCIFTNNTATYGGAIWFENYGALTNCNFTNNSASYGGAIVLYNKGNVINCNFIKNTATKYSGGAVYIQDGGTITDCNFTDNSGHYGGAIYIDVEGSVINCNFTNSSGYYGGAVCSWGWCSVTSCNITGGSAEYGGAVYFNYDGTVTSCNISGSSATYGGAVYSNSGSVTSCNISGSSATYGGAVYFQDAGNVMNCIFTNNTATTGGGAMFKGFAVNCTFIGNNAENGGAINDGSGAVNCTFDGNSAIFGGAVYFKNDVTVTNCNFTDNIASEWGGAVYFKNAGTVTNCNFNDNSAEYAGAIGFEDKGTVTNCNFNNNTVTFGDGGAVYFKYDGTAIKCNFTNNTAFSRGGAMFKGSAVDCTFMGNNAEDGGAVYLKNGYITNCNFTDNSANRGGAIWFNGYTSAIGCNFTGNNATKGSAIYFNSASSTKSITNCTFLNNKANAESFVVTLNENNITITFTGQDNLLNAIYSNGDVNFSNVTYWGVNGINNTDSYTPSRSNREAGQNITVVGVTNGRILNMTKITDSNGEIVIDDIGSNYYFIVRHDADSYYTEAEKTISNFKFNVNVTSQTTTNRTVNITAISNIPIDLINGTLLFILPNGTEINATYVNNGTWWALHTFGDVGDYDITASYSKLINVIINDGTISVRYGASVDVNNKTLELFVGDNFTIVATTTPEGLNVTYVPDDSGVYAIDETGKLIALKEGNGSVLVKVGGDGVYAKNYTVVNVTVNKNLIISAPNLTKYYKGSEKFVVNVTDSKNNPLVNKSVNITINGVTYYRTTDENGTASLDINLNSGEYPVNVVFGDEKVNSTVTVKTTIDASDITKVFRNATQYCATFVDVNGTPLANTRVSFNINGRIYNDTTDKYGIGKLNINLGAGDYIITATNTVTGEMKSNSIKVIPLIESSDLTKYFRNDSQFVVRIHSDNGSYVGAGEDVKFNINGIFYTRTTNATGHATLDINLPQGNYTVTTYYKDYSHGNGIEVLPILNASDLEMKYLDGSQFKAKLVDGEGNPYSNQNVTFNINGRFYNRTTDSDGVAKLNIELMPGEYIITSSFNRCNIANTIKITD